MSVFVIAEAGVNHNGERQMAFELIDKAVEAGVDAVKFQTFRADKLATANALKAEYQQRATGVNESQLSMLKKLELSEELHRELSAYCEQRSICFLSTAFDSDSLHFLVDEIGVSMLKIPSGEITNGPLLLEYAETGCDLVVSTGMSTLGEVEEMLGVIAYGFLRKEGLREGVSPSRSVFQQAYTSQEGHALLQRKLTLLHCTTEYPAAMENINLNAMLTLRDAFGLKVGFSDHSEGVVAPIVSTALGASLVEKHFTLDRSLPGPDHEASLEPAELKEMVDGIRAAEVMLGSAVKTPVSAEMSNRQVVRKSLVARQGIEEGTLFSDKNLASKRPGTGISPMAYWDLLGKASARNYQVDELIESEAPNQ